LQFREHRSASYRTYTPISADQIVNVVEELFPKRIVQVIPLSVGSDNIRVSAQTHPSPYRIGYDHVGDDERYESDSEENRDTQDESSENDSVQLRRFSCTESGQVNGAKVESGKRRLVIVSMHIGPENEELRWEEIFHVTFEDVRV